MELIRSQCGPRLAAATFVVAMVGLAPAFAAEKTLLEAVSLKDTTLLPPVNALGPIKPNGTWTQDGAAIVAAGRPSEIHSAWTIGVAGDAAWTDYRLSAR